MEILKGSLRWQAGKNVNKAETETNPGCSEEIANLAEENPVTCDSSSSHALDFCVKACKVPKQKRKTKCLHNDRIFHNIVHAVQGR